ncbi:SDR family NAD(P)-dependent oxidoreductase [Microbacterium sp. NPDC056569]|uniref:SDR family NAD(P)-dependent oxidoreductase n=1 Tax=Microbacterium sp. NPDC056569 TaxID=3345867 RepID=UPI003672C9F8
MTGAARPEPALVLTGATSGIGEASARKLARRSNRLIVQGPESMESVAGLLSQLNEGRDDPVVYIQSDFADLSAVREAARRIRQAAGGPLAGLINDAAIPGPARRAVTGDGHERALQINFLGPVLLTETLRDTIAPTGRIVNVASATHEMAPLDLDDIELERGYSEVRAYARTKLALILYTRWWSRHRPTEATAVSLHPGVIETDLLRAMFGSIGTGVDRGASNVLHALDAPAASGQYFDESKAASPSVEAQDAGLADALMDWTHAQLEGA